MWSGWNKLKVKKGLKVAVTWSHEGGGGSSGRRHLVERQLEEEGHHANETASAHATHVVEELVNGPTRQSLELLQNIQGHKAPVGMEEDE